jgi:hypothetical protein
VPAQPSLRCGALTAGSYSGPMAQPRAPRSFPEMVERLRDHTALLREYIQRAEAGDRRYLGEIAAKVRLLAIDGRSNKALMLRIGEVIDGTPWVVIDGPPGWTYLDGHKTGDRLTLREWLDTFQVGVRTPSSADTLVPLTKREFILIWAQQHGGAHEDWNLDERFQASRDVGLQISGTHVNDHALLEIARVVLHRAEGLSQAVTP